MANTKYRADSEAARHLRQDAGSYVRSLREALGITQRELSVKLKLDYYTFISQVETGASRVPPDAIVQWARALNVKPEEFARKLLGFYDPHMHSAIFGKK